MRHLEGGADIDETAYAESLMPLINKTEVVEFQSFIEHRRGLHFQSNPWDEDTPVPVQRAEWNRRFYRAEMRKFLL